MSTLDEKVKECGRLIVRMGTELMEETKRRQSLEAEVQELRMRLSGVEAVARTPLAPAGLFAPTSLPSGVPASSGYAAASSYPEYATAEYAGSSADAASVEAAATAAAAYEPTSLSYADAMLGGRALPTVPSTPLGGYGASDRSAWRGETHDALESTLQSLLPSRSAPASDAQPVPAVESSTTSQFASTLTSDAEPRGAGTSAAGVSALRISRQELDARVQQILGRHGQSLSVASQKL